MPIIYDNASLLTQFVWESANFATGGGSTTLGWNVAGLNAPVAEAVTNGILTAWSDNLRPRTDSDYTLASVRWETQGFSGEIEANLAGTQSMTGLPSNCAALVTYASVEKGPRTRGRNFWPGLLPEANVDERGIIAVGTVNTIQSAINDFFSDCESIEDVISQAVTQSATSASVTPPILPWPSVVSRIVQPVLGTQRRRVRR